MLAGEEGDDDDDDDDYDDEDDEGEESTKRSRLKSLYLALFRLTWCSQAATVANSGR